MIDLIKQKMQINGKDVLIETEAAESGTIFYNVNCDEGLTDEEYEQAVSDTSVIAEQILAQKTLFG